MNSTTLLKRCAPLLAILLMAAGFAFITAPSVAPEQPKLVAENGARTASEDASGTSEEYQILDDAIEGDLATMPGEDAGAEESDAKEQPSTNIQTNATVTKVVDGDTIDVRFDMGNVARVRMLGVNTPETVDPRKTIECFGKEASAFTKKTLQGKLVRLDADPEADERDKYGRLLRNVILEDGTDFNAMLVQQGYAHAYLSFPLNPTRKKQLSDLEKEAREERRGLWGEGCRN